MTQTTEGTGPGSVERAKFNKYLDVGLIKGANGTESSMDGRDLVIKGGEGYAFAGGEDDADGGDVIISGGMQHGDGNSGSVTVQGGDSSTEFLNSDPGNVTLRGGDGLGPADSDGGDVTIRGGDCEAVDTEGEAGSVTMRGGNSLGSNGGEVEIIGGYSGSSAEEGDNDGGDVTITGGGGGGTTARGGDVTITGGGGTAGAGVVRVNNLLRLPVLATQTDLDALIPVGQEENGMICYVTALNAFVVRANGAWVTLDVSAIV